MIMLPLVGGQEVGVAPDAVRWVRPREQERCELNIQAANADEPTTLQVAMPADQLLQRLVRGA